MKKFAQQIFAGFLTFIMLFSLLPAVYAEDSDSSDELPDEIVVTDIQLDKTTATIAVGQTVTLNAKVKIENWDGFITDVSLLGNAYTVEWTLGRKPENLALIPPTNTLTQQVVGERINEENDDEDSTVIVYIKKNGQIINSATCYFNVTQEAEEVKTELNYSTLELVPGGGRTLSIKVTPPDAEITKSDWTSDNPEVATVDPKTGEVKAVSAGVANIKVTVNGKVLTCKVTVQGIILDQHELELRERETKELTYTIYGESIEDEEVIWSLANESDANYLKVEGRFVTGIKESGEAIVVTATVEGTEYSDSCKVTVKSNTAQVIYDEATAGDPLDFSDLLYRLNRECQRVLGTNLRYLTGIQVETSQGTIYNTYFSEGDTGLGIGTGEWFYQSPSQGQMGIDDLSFVPKADFSGTATILYSGYDSNGNSFQGTIEVDVEPQEDVIYTVAADRALQLNPEDFNTVCKANTGRDLSFVLFTQPSESQGALYVNYISASNPGNLVNPSKEYRYIGSPNLSTIYFVPNPDYSGTVVLSYTGYDVNKNTFHGTLTIQVSGGQTAKTISYSLHQGGSLFFDDSDFNALSRSLTGDSLDYVRFTLPNSNQGTLYYGSGSTTVSANKNYYRSSSPYLDSVRFVAKSNFIGAVHIPFTARADDGTSFSGTVVLTVQEGSTQLSYQTQAGQPFRLSASDLDDLSLSRTGSALRYLRFNLPYVGVGTLYYDYDSDTSSHTKVSSSTNYYLNSSPYLGRVSFVPTTDFSGTVSISFTAYTVSGASFSDSLEILVLPPPAPSTISYTSSNGEPVPFDLSDFQAACNARRLGSLTQVTFSPSITAYGTLYSDYQSPQNPGIPIYYTSRFYPYSQPAIHSVAFVPADGFRGTVTLSYSAQDSMGYQYTGSIQILVNSTTLSTSFTDLEQHGWAVPSIEYLSSLGVVSGVGDGRYGPDETISRGDFVLMLFQAFRLPSVNTATHFWDVPMTSYYATAIQSAQSLRLIDGFSDGGFHPESPITREDAMLVLRNAMVYRGYNLGSPNRTLLSYYKDGARVSNYAKDSMALMLRHGVLSGDQYGRLNPQDFTTRAEFAVMLTNALKR